VAMTTFCRRTPGLAVLLALLTAACAQAPRAAAPPPPPAGETASAAPLFRSAAYGDTRDGHDVHRRIVADVLGFHPALVLQTGDLVHHGDAAAEWQTFDHITGPLRR